MEAQVFKEPELYSRSKCFLFSHHRNFSTWQWKNNIFQIVCLVYNNVRLLPVFAFFLAYFDKPHFLGGIFRIYYATIIATTHQTAVNRQSKTIYLFTGKSTGNKRGCQYITAIKEAWKVANRQIKDPITVSYFFFARAPPSFLTALPLATHHSRVPSVLLLSFYRVSKEK